MNEPLSRMIYYCVAINEPFKSCDMKCLTTNKSYDKLLLSNQ